MYDPNRETADSSSYGLGAVILQKQDDDTFRPVAYASRSMNDTERRYAQIEQEALAITWAMERWRELLLGMKHLRVETDHKPLVPLLSTKSLDELPLRIQRFRMRLMKYDFTISHTPGKLMYTADALSRSPLPDTEDVDNLRDHAEYHVNSFFVHVAASNDRLDDIREELKKDATLSAVIEFVRSGWPKNKQTL